MDIHNRIPKEKRMIKEEIEVRHERQASVFQHLKEFIT